MTVDESWKDLFENWPDAIARRGIVLSSLNEPMPFKGFMVKPEVLLLERQNPDSLGARYIMLRYDAIAAVKLVDPLNTKAFEPLGFTGQLST